MRELRRRPRVHLHRLRDDGATGLSAGALSADAASLHEAISDAVPLSAGGHNREVYPDETGGRIAELESLPGIDGAEAIAPNWRLQLGSLGSGIYFIEPFVGLRLAESACVNYGDVRGYTSIGYEWFWSRSGTTCTFDGRVEQTRSFR